MQSLKTTSKILLLVAALGMTVVGCERRGADQSSGASGTSGSSAAGSGSMGSSGGGTGGTGGSSSGSGSGSK